MACKGLAFVSQSTDINPALVVKHTFLEFDDDTSNGFEDNAVLDGMCSSRRGRALSDSAIDYSCSDTGSEMPTTEGTAWDDLHNTTSCAAQEVASMDSEKGCAPSHYSVPVILSHSSGLQSWAPTKMAPSAMEWDSQAARLRAQAREAEETALQLKSCLAAALMAQAQEAETQAREAQECLARRANAGNPQSVPMQNAFSPTQEYLAMVNTGNLQNMSLQNLPPSAAEFNTQAAKLTSQAQEAEEAARAMRSKAREAQSISVQKSAATATELRAQLAQLMAQAQDLETKAKAPWCCTNSAHSNGATFASANPQEVAPTPQVTTSVAALTSPQMTLVPMVSCMPVFPMCFSMGVPESAAVSTAGERPTVYKQEQGLSQPRCAAPVEFTTLMLRNIPNGYTRDMLIKLLDHEGLQGSYDLVFVAVDFHSLAGLGYGFVNFTSTQSAERAKEKLQGFDSWEVASQKVCEVAWGSTLQGLSAHVEHYRNSPVMHKSVPECYKPALFKGGVRQAFPGPTKQIRPPRVKAYTQ